MDSEARLIRWGGYAAVLFVVGNVVASGLLSTRATDLPADIYNAPVLLAFLAENRTFMATLWWLFITTSLFWIPAVLGFHVTLRETKLPLLFGTGLMLFSAVLYVMPVAFLLAIASVPDTAETVAQGMLAVAAVLDILENISLGIGGALLALASLETHFVSKWMGWAGLTGAVVYGVGDILRNVTGGSTVWLAFTLGGFLLFVIWFAGMGINMMRPSKAASPP